MLEVNDFIVFVVLLVSHEVAFWVLYYETRLEHNYTLLKAIVVSHFFLRISLLLIMIYFEIIFFHPLLFLFVFLVYSSYDLIAVAFPLPNNEASPSPSS